MENINYDLWGVAVSQAKNEIAENLKKGIYVSFEHYTAYYIFKHHLLKTDENIETYLNELINKSVRYFDKRDYYYKWKVDQFKKNVKDLVQEYVESYEKIVCNQ